MHRDHERCYRALRAKDARFDGWFVTAVRTTGIYCRPSCPARLPKAGNVEFHPTAAAAQHAGYRACKRCRPDASPGSPEWNVRQDVVARAMRLINDGVVDREGVGGLAARLGYSTRQLERHLGAELGAGPLALARARRAQTARVLIETTTLPFADLAFAAGFASIRQFNDTVRLVFATTPTRLRAQAGETVPGDTGQLVLRLPRREPFEVTSLFGHLAATAVPGCEEVRDGAFRRSLRLPHGTGIVALRPEDGYVGCRLQVDDLRDVPTAITRCRRLLDLDADPAAVVEALSESPELAPLVRAAPGRRIPRTVDEGELALRVVIGQQISVTAAATHLGRLVQRTGTPIDDPGGALTRVFPEPKAVAAAEPTELGLPTRRAGTLVALAAALDAGDLVLDAASEPEGVRAQLSARPGIGPWTSDLVSLRGLGDPDAFPATDLGVRAGARALGIPTTTSALRAHAERWRPWRGYATQYLWAAHDHTVNQWPPTIPTARNPHG